MKLFILTCIICIFMYGCSGTPLRVQNHLNKHSQQQYEVIGYFYGSATGIMLFNIIPIRQNSRFVRAYRQAIKKLGGDDLVELEISERWFWAYILNGYKTTVKGFVIKYK